MDTIFALASARGRAGVSVIRLSGSESHTAVQSLTRLPLPESHRAVVRRLYSGSEVLDEALVLLFDAGRSFTGEPVAELQVHGSVAVVSAILRVLGDFPGLRLAEAGEFTRRALENGRLDLVQVEGLSDLIEAETEAQRRQALRVLSGHIGRKVQGWHDRLLRAAALLEATIDFVDEDVPVDVTPEVRQILASLLGELRSEVAGSAAAERIRDGFEVAIIGAPNAGKSTLLNALAGRDAAITSDVAGTTRDVIEVRMDLRGLPVTLLDTAGLREAEDKVEAIGISRAVERATRADLRVFLLSDPDEVFGLQPLEDDLVVLGKADLRRDDAQFAVSGITGVGIDRLVVEIGDRLQKLSANASTLVRERHRKSVLVAIRGLETAEAELWMGAGRIELAAEALRQAIRALDSLVGKIGVEDVLGEIFANFCIGK
ncbi:MAG: tRNA uridine-5-carboxymethylaminomethyl(34) synthesis GTPase MnmE [Gemmobacter sp.]|nr:tRNA uridine-5-carboxymethylaminomethyl(34) synthesis GTPase MnmE [Gemmobacter sp.]